jgi:serine/threonine protein kinase
MRSYSQWIRDRRFVQSLGNQSASGFSELTPEAALGPVNDFASFIVFLNDMFLQDEFYTNLGMQTSMLVSGRLGSGAQFEVKRLKLDGGWAVRTSSDPHSRLSTGDSVILKKPHLLRDDEGRFSETNTIKSIVNELRILSHVPLRAHHNILDVFGIAWQPAAETSFGRVWPLVAVEYAPFGTLRRYLTSRKEQTYHARLKLVQDIAQGLQALHNCGIIHSDLKPDNVLVCKDKEGNPIAKISDFGHSIILSETVPYITWNKGTPLWMAPEWGQRVQARLLSFADSRWSAINNWHSF